MEIKMRMVKLFFRFLYDKQLFMLQADHKLELLRFQTSRPSHFFKTEITMVANSFQTCALKEKS